MRPFVLAVLGSVLPVALFAEEGRPTIAPERGTVRFAVEGDQRNIPQRYRLTAHEFAFELKRERSLAGSGVEVYRLTFPSPVSSDIPENNTVHAEYNRPKGNGPFPGVIVLDITAGDQTLSRMIANIFAQNGIAGLFVQMAHYGPRRPPGSKQRLLSPNVHRTLEGVRQTVLDVRRASAWLESRPEIDAKRLGILGTSLGSMVGAVSAEMEPRLSRVVILLGGGGLVDAYWDDPRAGPYRKTFEKLGGRKEQVVKMIAPADPITCAANLKDRRVLMIAGKRDEIVPPRATEALWEACGRPKIIWYDCTHIGAAAYFLPAMKSILEHFRAE